MLDIPEFQVKQNVTYLDGEKYYQAHVNNVSLNPITKSVEYVIFYHANNTSKGFMKITAHPHQIKESKHFKGVIK